MSEGATVTQMSQRKLSKFEGRQTTRVAVEIPGASGGLRDPMKFDPIEHKQFERVFVLLELECRDVDLRPNLEKDDDGEERDTKTNTRVERYHVVAGMFADPEEAAPVMNAHRERMAELREAERGNLTLLSNTGDPEGDTD